MKDLDFDELDKAVSSLMDKNTKKPEETIESPAAPVVKTGAEAAPEGSRPDSKPAATPNPPLATKRSGRFMDVVHPSSDMKNTAKLSSHPGVTIQPLNQPKETAAPSDDPVLPQESSPQPTPATIEPPKHDMPDPIDAHEERQVASAPLDPPADDAETTPDTKPEEPVETVKESVLSPFLPDTKVEKRPLGSGPTVDVSAEDAVSEEETDKSTSLEPVPAEFGSDVLAIESGAKSSQDDQPEEKDEAPAASAQLEGVKTTPAPAAVPVSIAQQYTPQESSNDTAHTAIYDTATDEHTMSHPAKKKSGWWVVLAIVLLALLGAAGGAYLYFAGII